MIKQEYIAHQETKGEFTLKIIQGDDCQNPREDCNWLGKMVCWHRSYNLGDEQPRETPNEYLEVLVDVDAEIDRRLDGLSWGDLTNEQYEDKEEIIREQRKEIAEELLAKNFIILPLYLYDHSGITISTGSFSCPWDSGQVGFIYVTVEQAKKEFEGEDWKEKTIKCLKQEVETYDDYLTGNCYGYTITNGDGETVDSCGGYLGDYKTSGILDDARYSLNQLYISTPLQLPLPTMEELSYA